MRGVRNIKCDVNKVVKSDQSSVCEIFLSHWYAKRAVLSPIASEDEGSRARCYYSHFILKSSKSYIFFQRTLTIEDEAGITKDDFLTLLRFVYAPVAPPITSMLMPCLIWSRLVATKHQIFKKKYFFRNYVFSIITYSLLFVTCFLSPKLRYICRW